MRGFAVVLRVNIVAPLSILVSCLTLTLGACGGSGSKSSGTGPSSTGSLTVNVIQTVGITPSVKVTGPGGYSNSLQGTQTLTGLTPGSYTITASGGGSGRTGNIIVSAIDTLVIIGSPATVTAGATAVATVSYVRPGTGNMWVLYSLNPLLAESFSANTLEPGAPMEAVDTLTLPDFISEGYGAFDAAGNLWIANEGVNEIEMYTPTQLVYTANLTPTVTIAGAALNGPDGLAFDASGNLWVANGSGSTVIEYTVAQIAASGGPTPAVTLSGFSQPRRIAFDAQGNLWVPNNSANTVVELTTSQLTASGSPAPAVTLSATGTSLDGPRGLAFDQSGNLWVANYSASTVVEFTAAQLAASGSPAPAVTLSGNGTVNATTLAFDNDGDLWVDDAGGGSTISEFTNGEFGSSGSPTPAVVISLSVPTSVMFDPAPAGFPLAGGAASASHIRCDSCPGQAGRTPRPASAWWRRTAMSGSATSDQMQAKKDEATRRNRVGGHSQSPSALDVDETQHG
jgi:sugar lactone lactonase YvrE